MKKYLAILFLIIGFTMCEYGTIVLTSIQSRNNIKNEFSGSYLGQLFEGLGFASVGLFLFIIGLVIVATKLKTQRKSDVIAINDKNSLES